MIIERRIFGVNGLFVLLIIVYGLFTSFNNPSDSQNKELNEFVNKKISTLDGKISKISRFTKGTFIFKNDCACSNCFDSLAIILKENYSDLPPIYLIINTKERRQIAKRKESKTLALKTGANEHNVFFNKIRCRMRNGKLIDDRITPFVIVKNDDKYTWYSLNELTNLKRTN